MKGWRKKQKGRKKSSAWARTAARGEEWWSKPLLQAKLVKAESPENRKRWYILGHVGDQGGAWRLVVEITLKQSLNYQAHTQEIFDAILKDKISKTKARALREKLIQ